MSAHKHEWIESEERARAILDGTPKIAEMHGLRIMAQRKLEPVTTQEERDAVRAFNAARGYANPHAPTVAVPDVKAPAPSAPGSTSSERGAKAIDPHRKGQYRRIMLALAKHSLPISRDELHRLTEIPIASLCGRLAELAPQWVECVEDACTSDAGLRVNGYQLTEHGRNRIKEAAA